VSWFLKGRRNRDQRKERGKIGSQLAMEVVETLFRPSFSLACWPSVSASMLLSVPRERF